MQNAMGQSYSEPIFSEIHQQLWIPLSRKNPSGQSGAKKMPKLWGDQTGYLDLHIA